MFKKLIHGNFVDVEFIFAASLRHRLLKSEVSSVAAIWLALHLTTRARHAVAGHQSIKPHGVVEVGPLWRLRRSTHIGGIAQIMARRRGRRARRLAPPPDPQVDGGADAAAQAESSKATTSRLGAIPIAGSRTVTLEDGNSDNASTRSGSQRLRSRLPEDSTRPHSFARMPH